MAEGSRIVKLVASVGFDNGRRDEARPKRREDSKEDKALMQKWNKMPRRKGTMLQIPFLFVIGKSMHCTREWAEMNSHFILQGRQGGRGS